MDENFGLCCNNLNGRDVLRIHIIDDEACILEMLLEVLSECSRDIRCFHSAEDYLLYMHSDAYMPARLIITDIRMGGMDGLTMIKNIRPVYPAVKIIVMSGFSACREDSNTYDARLFKPFNIPLLLSTVANLCSAVE